MEESIAVKYLIYDGFECDLQIVHSCQFHGLINALGSQRVPPENGVRIPTERLLSAYQNSRLINMIN